MRTTITFSLISLFALAPFVALADAKSDLAKVDSLLEACLNKEENLSTYGMNMCLSEAYTGSDKILNRAYKSIVAGLKKATGDSYSDEWNKESLQRLVKAQRAWIAYRDSESSLKSIEMLGGTGETQIELGTLHDMTKTRAIELEELFGAQN